MKIYISTYKFLLKFIDLQDTIQSTIGYALVDTVLVDPNIVAKSLRDKQVYETMIFRFNISGVDYTDEIDARVTYSEEDARAAHQAMIEKWRV